MLTCAAFPLGFLPFAFLFGAGFLFRCSVATRPRAVAGRGSRAHQPRTRCLQAILHSIHHVVVEPVVVLLLLLLLIHWFQLDDWMLALLDAALTKDDKVF